ncbi:MAG: serine/threonine protein kinase [Deltaproteobacteria bacterium]|nr:MAG: serine/threonine protein kinase [Deltaproteobacteria bacterium]
MSEVKETLDSCPKCQTDLRPYQSVGSMPSFCLQCKFPLLTIAGKYRLLEVVGQGAVGTVYLARHMRLRNNADRVVKVIKEEMLQTQTTVQRFFREVQITAELSENNDHIIRIYDDFGELPHLGYFYVMEYIRGDSVRKFIQSQTHLPTLEWCIDIMGQLSDALHTAHMAGVIHRDLKPDNMMLTQKGAHQHYLKVLDWGIAKPMVEEVDVHLTQGLVGTPHYMAPEQAMNQNIGPHTDIYAMAVILYELLTGVNPFVAVTGKKGRSHDSMVDLINAQLYKPPPPIQSVLPQRKDVTPELEAVLFKALEKNPSNRYKHVVDFWSALQEATGMTATTPISHINSHHPSTGSFAAPSTSDIKPIPTGRLTGKHAVPGYDSEVHTSSESSSQLLSDSVHSAQPSISPQDSWQETVVYTEGVNPGKNNAFLWVALVLGLVLGIGGWGWYRSRNNNTASTNNTLAKANVPPRRAEPRGRTNPPQVQPPERRDNDNVTPRPSNNNNEGDDDNDNANNDNDTTDDDKPKARPVVRRKVQRRRRVRRRRVRRRVRRRRPKPKPRVVERRAPPPRRPSSPCGKPNWIAVRVRPFLSRSAEVTAEGGAWKRKSSRLVCISPSTKLFSVVQEGYSLCAFQVPKRSKIRIRLREAGSGGLANASSCLWK